MQYITLAIAIIGSILSVVSFFRNDKKDDNKKASDTSYKQGQTDQMLKNIMDKLEKIESKLDCYEKDMDERINIALEHHIREYHNKND
jgi:hypothetical protein